MSKTWKYLLENFENLIVGVLFVGMSVFVLMQIVSRYIFRSPILFTEEAARYLYVWVAYFGMAMVTRTETHIRIDLLSTLTRGKARFVVDLVVYVVSLLLFAAIFVIGLEYTINNTIQRSPAMEIPKAIVYASLPAGALLSVLHLLLLIKRDVRTQAKSKPE